MRFLNEAITLIFFLLHMYTVCVVCSPALKKCMEELNLEFKNSEPIDDFLHGYLYIKYDTVFWDKDTDNNEEVYRGKKRLKKAAKGYYFELFYIVQDLDLPLLQSPENFCTSKFENNVDECIQIKHDIVREANTLFEIEDCENDVTVNMPADPPMQSSISVKPKQTPKNVISPNVLAASLKGKSSNKRKRSSIEEYWASDVDDLTLIKAENEYQKTIATRPRKIQLTSNVSVPDIRSSTSKQDDISLIGCGANVDGFVCFIHLYTQWTKTNEPNTLKGTENLSDDKLLEAICKGSEKFCNVFKKLSSNVMMTKILDVINSISEKFKIIDNLSDEKLLKDSGYEPTYIPDSGFKSFDEQLMDYTRYFEKHFLHDYSVEIYDRQYLRYVHMRDTGYLSNIASSSTSSNEDTSSGLNSDEHMDFLRYRQYMEHNMYSLRGHMDEDGIDLEYFYQYHQYKEKERRYKRNLQEVRLRRYGIPDVSYADLCKEFIRRKSVPRSFDIFYTMYIYDTLKDNCDRTRFINHSDYCDKYISG